MTRHERKRQLEAVISSIRTQWGDQAIFSGNERFSRESFPSGIAMLDTLLPYGGFPCGRINELIGYGTCGHLPIAAQVLALVQREQAYKRILVVNAAHSVDLATLAGYGVRLEELVILQPSDFSCALQMTTDLLRVGFAGILLFDRWVDPSAFVARNSWQQLDSALRTWVPFLGHSRATILWITELSPSGFYPEGLPLAHFADIRLRCEHQRWLMKGQQVVGYVSRVTLLKSRGSACGKEVLLQFDVC